MISAPAREPPDDIAAVWDRLNDTFLGIYREVVLNTATVKWQAQVFDNPHHYLIAYASFDRVGRGDHEDLVLDVGIAKTDGIVVWSSDASQSRGALLVEGPTLSFPDTEPLSSWVGSALEETIAFFECETPNFIAYLNQEPTPYDVE